MDVSLSELILTVAVASLVEIIYHVKLVRKIGADISFEDQNKRRQAERK